MVIQSGKFCYVLDCLGIYIWEDNQCLLNTGEGGRKES